MDFLEKDLERILYYADPQKLKERGLPFEYDYIYRQFRLPPYGIIDLLTIKVYSKTIIVNIYELKNKVLTAAAFWQTVRYIKGVKHAISKFNLDNHYTSIRGIMIGREISTDGEFCFIPTIESNIDIYTYNYTLEGLIFDRQDDTYTSTGFKGVNVDELQANSFFQLGKLLLFNNQQTVEDGEQSRISNVL